jgi:hypothetical protein
MKSIVLVAFPVALAAAGCQRDPGLSAPEVPEAIEAPADQRLLFHAAAVGVQIYACTAKEGGYEWVLKAPDADLLGPRGEKLGTHYAGPTWEASDGSKVVGALKAKADAPDANAVPWLLLESKQNEGNGAFAAVKSVQRVDTRGGKASATGCVRRTSAPRSALATRPPTTSTAGSGDPRLIGFQSMPRRWRSTRSISSGRASSLRRHRREDSRSARNSRLPGPMGPLARSWWSSRRTSLRSEWRPQPDAGAAHTDLRRRAARP